MVCRPHRRERQPANRDNRNRHNERDGPSAIREATRPRSQPIDTVAEVDRFEI
jgi:hypothetical protein